MNDLSIKFNYIIFFGICLVFIVVPLAFTTYTQNIVLIKPSALHLISTFIFFIFILDSLQKREFIISDNQLSLPIVAFLIMATISAYYHPFKNYQLEEMANFTSYFLIAILTIKYVNSRKRLKIIIALIFFIVILSVGYAILQLPFVDMDPVNWGGQKPYVSFYGNKNFFAGAMINLFPIIMSFIFLRKLWSDKIVLGIITIFTIFTILYSKNRSVIFIGLPALFFIFFLLQIFFGQFKFILKKNILLSLIVAIISVIIIFIIIFILWPEMQGQFSSVFQANYGTNLVRFRMWTGAWRMTTDKPLFGQGIGTFQLTFPKFRPTMYHRSGVSHNTRHSHCEFLEHLSETGIIGLGIFLWLLVTYFYFSIKFVATTKDEFLKHLTIGCIAGTIGALGDNLASVNMRWHSDAFITYFIMGLTFAIIKIGERTEEEEILAEKKKYLKKKGIQQTNILIYPLAIIFTILFIIYFYRIKTIWTADRLLKIGMGELEYAGGGENPTNPHLPQDRVNQLIEQAKLHLTQSLELNENEMSTLYKLGYALLRKGEFIDALNLYLAIVHNLAPNYAQIHNNIGLLYRQISQSRQLLLEILNDENKYKNLLVDSIVRRELLNKYQIEKQIEILQRIFVFKSVIQFEWATSLENNQKNQINMAQLYYQIGKYDNSLHHFHILRRVCSEEITYKFMLLNINRIALNMKDYNDDIKNNWINNNIKPFQENKSQYIQALLQIATLNLNNFKNINFAFDYLFRLSNLNYENLQEFFKLASFLFQNNNDNKLINLIDFRLFNIEKNKLSQNDIFFLNQIIQQINMIIQNRNDVNIKNDYKILLSKIHYKLNNDSEAINILNEILQINPDNKKAKQLQEIINKKL
ncbi:MAG TPA: O-antigen ligase family protein [bacterium]|nr:O-antigen ligase family protein [bacterium]